ncbi:hypothetical protein [Candidatus Frankia alpina]|uniref:hypothetical protein n=1 Tax=Candidatus Frankia alpina TaxID=2699483 RepID=UPI0013D22951|nr:hypothetical protein [Candidatus Frankia alpina]
MSERTVLATITCSITRHPGVGRFGRQGANLELKGVSRQRPGSVLPSSGSRTKATGGGALTLSPDYRGCPSCVVRCTQCHQLACWDSERPIFECPLCGLQAEVRGVLTEFSALDGG